MKNAFRFAEESLDILRIATPTARVHLPQYAIGINVNQKKAFLAAISIEFYKYFYHPRKQKLIDRLNNLCVKPSSKLEERIKNAPHFCRIGDNHSPDYQKLFFYVAAIENMILGGNDRDVLRWKFSEKGAILLTNNRKERLDLAKELKKLYDERSNIAHGGKSDYHFFMTTSARRYSCSIIMNILHLADTYGLQTVTQKNKTGKSLDEYINNIIYTG